MFARRLPHGMRALALALIALAALVASGCGSEAKAPGANGPDPATVAPADAFLYGQAIVRPSGALKDDALAAARKVLRVEDASAKLRRLLDEDRGRGQLNFSHDVEPWLGERVGGFLLAPTGGGDEPEGAVALAIGDRGAFEDARPRIRDAEHLRSAGTYHGVAYDRDGTDGTTYAAPIEDFYVVGSLAGLRAAIDASKGSSLAGATRFRDAVGSAPDDALALFYADPKAIVAAVGHRQTTSPAARKALARFADAGAITATLTATAEEIAIEGSADRALTGIADADSQAEVSVGQLPGDSWLALATPPLGPLISNALDATGMSAEAEHQVGATLGLDLDRDLLDPLGGLGLFVRGESPLDIGGGALLQLTDAAAAQRLLTRIEVIVQAGAGIATRPLVVGGARGFQVQIPQSPQPIVVLAKGDRLAAGYAASSAQDLLDPQQRFDDGSAGKAAIDTLGDGYVPSFVLIVPPLAALLRSLDQLQVVELSRVLPYLDAYRSVAIGTKRDGDRLTVRAVAALR